jgi:magnesium transporter
MISSGSEALCDLIGHEKYQLLMAFLPLSSAISGNCGLQATTLSTRAISHAHVSKKQFLPWLWTELKVAGLLGLGIGAVIGVIAYQASGFDASFGLTIFFANVISILIAGLTGTLLPFLFTFVFQRDAGKWAGPIETGK